MTLPAERFRKGDLLVLHTGHPIDDMIARGLVLEAEDDDGWLLRGKDIDRVGVGIADATAEGAHRRVDADVSAGEHAPSRAASTPRRRSRWVWRSAPRPSQSPVMKRLPRRNFGLSPSVIASK